MKKKILLLFFSLLSFNAIHAKITWTLSDDGTLTISGTDMPDYTNGAPWHSQQYKITNVLIKNGVTNIGDYAFQDCYGLTSITIPNSVKRIGSLAFKGCSSIASVIIPNSVTSIGLGTFRDCTSLTSITIPNSVTSIGTYAFQNCSGLTSITISNSVTKIGWYVFNGCSALTSITIPNSVTSIDGYAFYGCGLTSITIPNSVTTIGESAFDYCNLKTVTISSSVTSLGKDAFGGQQYIESITCGATIPPVCSGDLISGFAALFSNTILYVPVNSIDQYKAAKGWKNFKNIQAIQDESTDIKGVRIINNETPVYDMNGRMTSEKDLKSGLYIKNGKKVVVK